MSETRCELCGATAEDGLDRLSQLLCRFARGNDAEAMARFFEECEPTLKAFALKRCRYDLHRAEDVFAETMCKMIRALRAKQFDCRSKAIRWARSIVRNTTIDQLRQLVKERERFVSSSAPSDESSSTIHEAKAPCDFQPELIAEANELPERFSKALKELTPNELLVYELRRQGHTYAEIANATGICQNTVGTLLASARKKLRRFLS